VLLACAAALATVAISSPVGAAGDSGARPQARAGDYAPPVRGPVIDPFRAPLGPYGPGNRGLEYATEPGAPALAIGGGTVSFAGQVAGRLVVTVEHPDGLRSSLVGLATVSVTRGQAVERGQPLGRTGSRLHLGVRRGEQYLDPATLFDRQGPARLVPRPQRREGGGDRTAVSERGFGVVDLRD
jgi:murein DD-endopeptidase MepM/ murein hydrolase activator NlpD